MKKTYLSILKYITLTLFAFFLSLIIFYTCFGLWSKSWIKTTGEIDKYENYKRTVSRKVETREGTKTEQYEEHIFSLIYSYKVNSILYKSTRISYPNSDIESIEKLNKKQTAVNNLLESNKLEVNDTIIVFYNPKYPSISVLKKGIHFQISNFLPITATIVFYVIILFALRSDVKKFFK